MVSQPISRLPSTTELPCSDDTPVDNEEQNLLPNLLLFVLASLWAERMDWYFGVDMAVYHTTGVNPRVPVVPDAFLSLGVERRKASREGKGRLSYAVWEEGEVVPLVAFEMVSQTPGGEYDKKLKIYQQLGVLYYVLYNPLHWKRDLHQPFEVYKLEDGEYQPQIGEPFWMPEVGLGMGRALQRVGGIEMEVLLWYNEQGQPYLVPDEELMSVRSQLNTAQQQIELEQQRTNMERQQAEAERQQAEAERQQAEAERQQAEIERQRANTAQQQARRLADYMRSLGLDPDNLPDDSSIEN